MRRIPLAGPKSNHILSKTIRSCLCDLTLPYNWNDKVPATILNIALARSVVLQDIARIQGKCVKTAENILSRFLNSSRLDIDLIHRACVIAVLGRLGKKHLQLYQGKAILIADHTSYEKSRSRGKQRRMPKIGQVRKHNLPGRKTILVPGYQEMWIGLLLKRDKACLGITRRLFTEFLIPGFSQNAIEEEEIRKAKQLIWEALKLKVIVVADRGFRRKELLHWLKRRQEIDFVIRIEGKLTVEIKGWKGLLKDLLPYQTERWRMFWRDSSKHPIYSSIRTAYARFSISKEEKLSVRMLCLVAINRDMEPMYLATSLPISGRHHIEAIVKMYSSRWTIETFFLNFKESFHAGRFRVFGCWKALERLLAMAHMAFLILHLMYVLGEEGRRWFKGFWRAVEVANERRCAARRSMTLGRFLETVAIALAPPPLQFQWDPIR